MKTKSNESASEIKIMKNKPNKFSNNFCKINKNVFFLIKNTDMVIVEEVWSILAVEKIPHFL